MDNGAENYRRFLTGDDDGIVEIIKEYKDGLTFYLNGFVGSVRTAEELAEDTFFRLMVKKPKYKQKYSFKTWLYTIGRNIAIDYLRHNARASCLRLEDCESALKDEKTLERGYLKEERKIAVHRAMERLNPEYRRILYLIYFEDFDSTEVIEITKKSRRQIANLLYRAKISLRNELNKDGFTYEEL